VGGCSEVIWIAKECELNDKILLSFD